MTIMGYLFEYVLEHVCHGNKSEYARMLGYDYVNLQKQVLRFRDGGGSVRVMEALLNLCCTEEISLDEAMKNYAKVASGTDGADMEAADAFCDGVIRDLRITLDRQYHELKDVSHLLATADTFMRQLEKTYCTAKCRKTRDCATDCPCMKFIEYWSWLRDETLRSVPKKP